MMTSLTQFIMKFHISFVFVLLCSAYSYGAKEVKVPLKTPLPKFELADSFFLGFDFAKVSHFKEVLALCPGDGGDAISGLADDFDNYPDFVREVGQIAEIHPEWFKAWEVARQFSDPSDVSILARLTNDMGDRPNLASIITNHTDPDGAFNTWNRVSLGKRFVAKTKFYDVMDELVPPGVDYNFTWTDPNTGESFTWGAPTSGLKVYSNVPEGTFIIGGFGPDLKFLLPQFPTATIGDPLDLVLPDHVNQLNNWISAGFPQPTGSQFNLLNVYDPLFLHVVNNPQVLATYGIFTDRGAGKFFTFINGPWMDAAVQQNQFILVASNVSEHLRVTPTKLSGFGKEVHRLEWIHGYRFNPANNTMVPPSEATGLSALTREDELNHGLD